MLEDTVEKFQNTIRDLRKSQTLEDLCPGCFAHGTAKVRWTHEDGKPSGAILGTVVLGNGEERELPREAYDILQPTLVRVN
jgi:hypothetical protein